MNTTIAEKPPGHKQGTSHWKWLEVIVVVILMPVGGILGTLTGWLPLSPILGVIVPLGAATFFLHREQVSWHSLIFGISLGPGRILIWTAVILLATYVSTTLLLTPVLQKSGVPPIDIRVLRDLIEGNITGFLIFVIPVSWGSAAIGEELLVRGFLLHRISSLSNDVVAVILQAALFALAHFYQGLMGVANIFVLALIFGTFYIRLGRNLLPLILAHGIIDTVSITLLYLGLADYITGAG